VLAEDKYTRDREKKQISAPYLFVFVRYSFVLMQTRCATGEYSFANREKRSGEKICVRNSLFHRPKY